MNFEGFSENAIVFLKELAKNNNKDWFEQHRKMYTDSLLEPLKLLVTDLQLTLKSIDNKIETTPAVNKTISRIHRDTRFSNDKSPFRTSQWLSFKRPSKIWGNVPEFYFYFTPEKYEFGMGFYSATPQNMEKIRSTIFEYPEKFKSIIDVYNAQKIFVLGGENYKRPVQNSLSEEFQEWFQKKSLYLRCEKKMDETFFTIQLKDLLEKAFIDNSALYQFLIESII